MSYGYKIDKLLKDWENNVTKKISDVNDINLISEFMLHIARIVNYPTLDVSFYLQKINKLGEELKTNVNDAKFIRPTQIIDKLNEFVFHDKKFQPNVSDYYNPANNYLNIVLEKRIGIPITLSILYIHLASFLDFDLQPISFPSHFLVKYVIDNKKNEYIVIDPFNKGRIMDEYVLQDIINKTYPRLNVNLTLNLLEKANSKQILTRILSNLKIGYAEVDALDKIVLVNEMILIMNNLYAEGIRDRGIIFYRYKKFKDALENLYKYIELNPEAEDIDHILALIQQIRNLGKQT